MPKPPAFALSAVLITLLLLGGVGFIAYRYRGVLTKEVPSRTVVAPVNEPSSPPKLTIIPAPPQAQPSSIAVITPQSKPGKPNVEGALPSAGPTSELALLVGAAGIAGYAFYIVQARRQLGSVSITVE